VSVSPSQQIAHMVSIFSANLSQNYYNLAWIEGFAIFLAVFIVVLVGSYNDYKKEEQFFKLYALDQQGKFVSN